MARNTPQIESPNFKTLNEPEIPLILATLLLSITNLLLSNLYFSFKLLIVKLSISSSFFKLHEEIDKSEKIKRIN